MAWTGIERLKTVVAAAALLGACLGLARAQGNEGWDYYRKYNTPPKDLLYNVEKYHLYEGIAKLGRHEYKYAQADFGFMLNYFPNHPRALLLMMDTLFQTKRPILFEQYITRAIDMFPDTPSSYVVLGIYKHRLGRYQEAIQPYEHALELKPDYADAHYNLALTYVELNQLEKANQHAQRAYALGYPLPGLRTKLQQLKAWDPDAALPTARKSSKADAKTAAPRKGKDAEAATTTAEPMTGPGSGARRAQAAGAAEAAGTAKGDPAAAPSADAAAPAAAGAAGAAAPGAAPAKNQ